MARSKSRKVIRNMRAATGHRWVNVKGHPRRASVVRAYRRRVKSYRRSKPVGFVSFDDMIGLKRRK